MARDAETTEDVRTAKTRAGRGDGDVDEAVESSGRAAVGLRRMKLPGCGDAVAWNYRGAVPFDET
jgi:hypothetical protein